MVGSGVSSLRYEWIDCSVLSLVAVRDSLQTPQSNSCYPYHLLPFMLTPVIEEDIISEGTSIHPIAPALATPLPILYKTSNWFNYL